MSPPVSKGEIRLESVVAGLGDAVVAIDVTGQCRFVSEAWTEITGHMAAESVDCPFHDFVHADDRGHLAQVVTRMHARQRGGARHQFRVRTWDDSWRWVEMHARPWLDADCAVLGVLATLTDVTEQRRIEQILHQLQAQYRTLVESVREVVFQTDAEGAWSLLNPAWTELTGHEIEYCLGRPLAEFLWADDLRHGNPLAPLLSGQQEQLRTELRVSRIDGSDRWVELHARVMHGDAGLTGTLGTLIDVTARKEFEADLQLANERLAAASEAKSTFLANMSHEIRTPMTAILGYADLLRDPKVGEAERREFLDTIVRNGNHLLALLNDILDLSKIEAGRMSIQKLAADPCDLVADVDSLMRGRARDRGLQFHVLYDTALPMRIETDPNRLRQVLLNLVGNAIKFTESGSVTLKVGLEEREAGPRLRFDVIDTGVGMSAEQLARLFQPFAQADESTTRRFGGTGLGLVISKRFAQLLGGEIAVASALGHGSRFTLRIAAGALEQAAMRSREECAQHRMQAAAASATGPQLGGRVLLAEDGPDNQRLIGHLLRRAGAEVVVAADGAQACTQALAAAAAGTPFDLVLMDIVMPVFDGYAATRKLREAGYARPIVALTANAMAGEREKCLDAGCDDFATKPIDRVSLLETISKYVGARR